MKSGPYIEANRLVSNSTLVTNKRTEMLLRGTKQKKMEIISLNLVSGLLSVAIGG